VELKAVDKSQLKLPAVLPEKFKFNSIAAEVVFIVAPAENSNKDPVPL
jgi:hypothetical protein